jgi:hypothetical protein
LLVITDLPGLLLAPVCSRRTGHLGTADVGEPTAEDLANLVDLAEAGRSATAPTTARTRLGGRPRCRRRGHLARWLPRPDDLDLRGTAGPPHRTPSRFLRRFTAACGTSAVSDSTGARHRPRLGGPAEARPQVFAAGRGAGAGQQFTSQCWSPR